MSYILLGHSIMFDNIGKISDFAIENLPIYAILGLVTGLYSLYFMRMSASIESVFKKMKKQWLKILIGGVLLSVLIFLFPSFYGEGYEALSNIMNGHLSYLFQNSPFYDWQYNDFLLLAFLFFLLMFKTFATAFTTGAGGIGGVFAPSLFLGGIAGCLVATFINTFFDTHLPVLNFILAGMSGVMGSVMKAPLTAIFLIAEISGGYQLFVPLMLTTLISCCIFYPFEKYSVYTKSLAAEGESRKIDRK